MLVSEYIVDFLIKKNITDVFGYPGGMVTYLMDALSKHDKIKTRLSYNEQGASFAACGYAQVTGNIGVAYATSGPGVTNLLTGIANAYFDSISCMFLTGQVNTYESKGNLAVRQKGFQEMDVVSITHSITKYSVQVTDANMIKYELEKAYHLATSGRKGPVVLDIPMNIQRTEINEYALVGFDDYIDVDFDVKNTADKIVDCIKSAKRPLIIAGAGIKSAGCTTLFRDFVEKFKIPVVTSMIAVDCLPSDAAFNIGFIGAYGHRWANVLAFKADLIVTMGTRLDGRQVGSKREAFAPQAKILRLDIDCGELEHKLGANEQSLYCDIKPLLTYLKDNCSSENSFSDWLATCNKIKNELQYIDEQPANAVINKISEYIPQNAIITTDVGQNQVWVAQSLKVKKEQTVLFSGGHGAMGYSLPAAIGAFYATGRPVVCFTGDGGLQMNIQELQMIARDRLPIKIVLLNNKSLGMIRHFQEMYFKCNYTQTIGTLGYDAPDFSKIAKAYGLDAICIDDNTRGLKDVFCSDKAVLIDVNCGDKTYVFPKLAVDKPVFDQEPLLERFIIDKIMKY